MIWKFLSQFKNLFYKIIFLQARLTFKYNQTHHVHFLIIIYLSLVSIDQVQKIYSLLASYLHENSKHFMVLTVCAQKHYKTKALEDHKVAEWFLCQIVCNAVERNDNNFQNCFSYTCSDKTQNVIGNCLKITSLNEKKIFLSKQNFVSIKIITEKHITLICECYPLIAQLNYARSSNIEMSEKSNNQWLFS